MATRAEIWNAVLKGLGLRPTFYLLRWVPTLKAPFHFDLVEIMKCSADGGIVTRASAQSPRGADHLGHRILSPNYWGLWTWLKVQLRVIR
jgi:hypothetical protein